MTSTPSSLAVRRRACPPSAHPEAEPLTVAVTRVGHLGEGLGTTLDGRPVCVPFSLPGEVVTAQVIGRRGAVVLARAGTRASANPDRVVPPCAHFGVCGGCALQHWANPVYLSWKVDLLRRALQGAGYVDPNLLPIVQVDRRARRRVDLAFKRIGRAVTLGLHQSGSHDIVDVNVCEVLHPKLQALVAPLRRLLAEIPIAGANGSVQINLLDSGPDIIVRAQASPDTATRTLITNFARSQSITRMHWARGSETAEALCMLDRPLISFAGVAVTPPPFAFLQATSSGEAAIVAAVIAGLPASRPRNFKILELYSGCGTLTFPLARLGHVTAYEGNLAALTALRLAADQALPGRVTTHHRDLVRQPVNAREIAGFSTAVLDPPWAGSSVQIAALARSALHRVIYVSCNPAALRRDAELLHRVGFKLEAATPVDQFLWSAQLEAVAVFSR